MGIAQTVLITGTGVESGTPRGAVFGESGRIVKPYKHYQWDRQAAAQTDKLLWGPAPGQAIVLMGLVASTDTAMEIIFYLGAQRMYLDFPDSGGGNILFPGGGLKLPVGAQITYTSSAAGNHGVAAYGDEES